MAKPTSVEAYLAALPADQRAVMESLRRTIRAAAPDATELISYDMPAFKSNGRFLVSYAAFKNHYSLFPANAAVVEALRDEIAPYLAGKGTIRFPAAAPVPMATLTKVVKVRLAENGARSRR